MSNMPVTIMLLSFGDNLDYHSQANFCIMTAKKFAPKGTRFVVYTDRPNFYQWAKRLGDFLEVRHTPKSLLNDWEGEYKFFWRLKIMAMLDCARNYPGHLLYVDSDTIFTKPLDEMIEELSMNKSFMHLKENTLATDRAKDKLQMWHQTKFRTYAKNLLVDEKSYMKF